MVDESSVASEPAVALEPTVANTTDDEKMGAEQSTTATRYNISL